MKRARIRMSFSDPFLLLSQRRLTGAPSRPTSDEQQSDRAAQRPPARNVKAAAFIGRTTALGFKLIGPEVEA
jgi:hypothetical protein